MRYCPLSAFLFWVVGSPARRLAVCATSAMVTRRDPAIQRTHRTIEIQGGHMRGLAPVLRTLTNNIPNCLLQDGNLRSSETIG